MNNCLPTVQVVTANPGAVTLLLELPPNSPVFAGHFPGQPVLAGVIQLDWALRLAIRYLGTTDVTARRFAVKFQRVIVPGMIRVELTLASDQQKLVFSYWDGAQKCSSGTLYLTGETP